MLQADLQGFVRRQWDRREPLPERGQSVSTDVKSDTCRILRVPMKQEIEHSGISNELR